MHTAILTFLMLAGGFTFLCGWLLKFRNRLGVLALYDPKATRDKKGLARWAGSNLMILAILQLFCGLAGIVAGHVLWAGLGFISITLFITIILALGTTKYSKKGI